MTSARGTRTYNISAGSARVAVGRFPSVNRRRDFNTRVLIEPHYPALDEPMNRDRGPALRID